MQACSIVQAAVPAILADTPPEFFTDTMQKLKSSAELCFGVLSKVPGLTPVMPQAAMYMMCGIDMEQFSG